jgi:hypothetical protein
MLRVHGKKEIRVRVNEKRHKDDGFGKRKKGFISAVMKKRTLKLFKSFSATCISGDAIPCVLIVKDQGFLDPNGAEKRLAFLSGHHARLGASSPLMILPREILVKICGMAWPLHMKEHKQIMLQSPFIKPNSSFDILCDRTLPSYPGLRKLLAATLKDLNIKPPVAIKKNGSDNIGSCFKDCMQTNERRFDSSYISSVLLSMFLVVADITGQIFYPTVNIWHTFSMFFAVNICATIERSTLIASVSTLLYGLTNEGDACLAFECAATCTCKSDACVWNAEVKLRNDFRTMEATHDIIKTTGTEVCTSTYEELAKTLAWLRRECPFDVATVAMNQYIKRHTQGRTLVPVFDMQTFMKRERYREFAFVTGTTSYEQYNTLNWTQFGETHQITHGKNKSTTARKKRSKCGEGEHEHQKKSKQV